MLTYPVYVRPTIIDYKQVALIGVVMKLVNQLKVLLESTILNAQ